VRIHPAWVVVLGLLVAPGGASATTFCVHSPPGCSGTAQPTVNAAIAASAGADARDRIEVGPGTFTESVAANGPQDVDIVGQGPGITVFTGAANPIFAMFDPESTATGIGVRLTANGQTGFDSGGTLSNVGVTQAATGVDNAALGILLESGGTVSNCTVDLPTGAGVNHIGVRTGGNGNPRASDCTLRTNGFGVVDDRVGGSATFERLRINASQGVYSLRGTSVAQNLVITLNDALSSGVMADATVGSTAAITVFHTTILAPGNSFAAVGARTLSAGRTSTVLARDLIVRTTDNHTYADQSGGGSASVNIDYSDYDQSASLVLAGTVIHGTHSVNVDPRFVNAAAADYRLRFDSPLIDAGDTAGGGTPFDFRRLTRIVDGNGDGAARRDMGAFEYQRAAPTAAIAAPASASQSAAVAFSAAGSSDVDGDSLTYSWRFDDGATATGVSASHAFATPGPHGVQLTVVDAAGLHATASRTIDVRAVGGPPPPPGACERTKRGSGRSNRLQGSSLGDRLLGLRGNDLLRGLSGDDCLDGGRGRDRLFGGPGADRLVGGSGNDLLDGGSGGDRLAGGSGADRLKGGSGRDALNAGSGNDRVNAADGTRETVRCGPGSDRATIDRVDRARGCERVRRR
jgi:Ca2+-binding RTX toxin-like protein